MSTCTQSPKIQPPSAEARKKAFVPLYEVMERVERGAHQLETAIIDGDWSAANKAWDDVFSEIHKLQTPLEAVARELMPDLDETPVGDDERERAAKICYTLGMLADCLVRMDRTYVVKHTALDGSIETDSTRFCRMLFDKIWDLDEHIRGESAITVQDFEESLDIIAMTETLKRALSGEDRLGEKAICEKISDDFDEVHNYLHRATRHLREDRAQAGQAA